MGKNNQQRRKAKAKQRARARARTRNPQPHGHGPGRHRRHAEGFGVDPRPAPTGRSNGHSAGSAFRAGTSAPAADWDAGSTLLALHRWLLEADVGDVAAAAAARQEVLRDLRVPTRKAAVISHLTDSLLDAVERLWTAGWEPADLLRIAIRELPTGAEQNIRDTICLSLSRYAATTVAPRWHDQLRQHELITWWAPSETPLLARLRGTRSDDDALTLMADTAGALSLMSRLPALQQIDPPPGKWRAPAGGGPKCPAPSPKMLERVRALLAKAESTPYAAEAETFTTAAQAMMARHRIDRAMLAAERPQEQGEVPVARRLGVDRPYEAPKAALLNSVASANRCRVVWTKELGFASVVGFADDITAVETLFTSLLLQAIRAMTAHGSRRSAAGRSRTRSFRRSFLLAYASRIGQRLAEATQQEVDAREAERTTSAPIGPGRALVTVLQERSEEVDQAVDSMFGDLAHSSAGSANSAEGWVAGTVAADAANLSGARAVPPQ